MRNNNSIEKEEEYVVESGHLGVTKTQTSEHKGAISVVIPEGVMYIGEEAFSNFVNLESIVIPDSVVEINAYAFKNCKLLKILFFRKI